MSPDVGTSRWLIQRRSVLFPEPLAPSMLTTLPRLTSNETPLRTSSDPNFLCTSTTRIVGISLICLAAARSISTACRHNDCAVDIDKSLLYHRPGLSSLASDEQPSASAS